MIRRVIPYLTVFFVVILSRCQWGTQSASISNSQKVFDRKNSLFVAGPEFPTNLDWQKIDDPKDGVIAENIMEGLTEIDFTSRPIKPKPQLAVQWEAKDDNQTYIFTLKDNVVWTDDVPLTAQHFVDAFERLAKTNNSLGLKLFSQIKNFKEFANGDVKDFKDVGVKADGKQVTFHLNADNSSFPILLSHPIAFPIRQDLIKQKGEGAFTPINAVTLGSYKILKAEKEKILILTAFSKYHGPQPKVKDVIFYFGLNPNNLKTSLKQKVLDLVLEPQQALVDYFKGKNELVYLPNWGIVYLTFHTKVRPFENPIFRRAMATSINRDELVTTLGHGYQAISGMILPGFFGYESNRGVRFDPEAGKALLKKGFSWVEKYLPFELRYESDDSLREAAELVRSQIEKNLGLKINVVKASLEEKLPKKPQPTFYLVEQKTYFPDPDSILGISGPLQPFLTTGWKNPIFNDQILKGRQESDEVTRQRFYSKAQHILTEGEMPVIPLFLSTDVYYISQRVQNWLPHSRFAHRLRDLSVD